VTQDELKECLHYDPETGWFTWLVSRSGVARIGVRAGGVSKVTGRRMIKVCRRRYFASHLATLYMTGSLPIKLVDHRNRDKADDRWENLRDAMKFENAANSKTRVDNVSGLKGVHKNNKCCKWEARIRIAGVRKYLGLYDTPELAHAAYTIAAKEAFGEFARP
jgi:hypothetical protein